MKFYQNVNFWIGIAIAIGGFYVGFPEGAAREAVTAIFTLFTSGGAFYQYFKSRPASKGRAWFADANFWNYAGASIMLALPQWGGELIPALRGTTEAVLAGNWNGVIASGLSLLVILYKIFKKQPEARQAT